jgi:hypothetical protein
MKSRHVLIALLILLGFMSGYLLGLRLTLIPGAKRAITHLRDTQFFATTISIATLERLERGDVDGAKRLLANEISGYYHSDMIDASENSASMRKAVEELSTRSPVLKKAMDSH